MLLWVKTQNLAMLKASYMWSIKEMAIQLEIMFFMMRLILLREAFKFKLMPMQLDEQTREIKGTYAKDPNSYG